MADPQALDTQYDPREALQNILRVVRRNTLQVAFTTLVALMLGMFLAELWPNKYESMTQFVLREQNIIQDSAILSDLQDVPLPKKLETLTSELRSSRRIGAVLDELQWPVYLQTATSPAQRRDLLIKVAENLDVTMEPDPTGATNVSLSFRWTDPRMAANFVNRMRDHWIGLVIDGHRRALFDRVERAESVVAERERTYADALANVHHFQAEHDTLALLTVELNQEMQAELELRLVEASAAHLAAAGAISELEAKLATMDPKVPQIVAPDNPDRAKLMVEAETAESELKGLVAKYTETHPKVVAARAKAAETKAKLAAAGGPIEDLTVWVTNTEFVLTAQALELARDGERSYNAQVSQLERDLSEVEKRLRILPKVQRDLDQLEAKVEVARAAVMLAQVEVQPIRERVRLLRAADNQSRGDLEAIVGSPFEILDIGVEPEDPVLPMAPILIALALMGGLALGIALPIGLDLLKTSFTTATDITRTLGIPVLGTVDLILTQRDIRARAIQRALTVLTMVLVLAALGMAFYIYRYQPEVLPASLHQQLRDLRMALT